MRTQIESLLENLMQKVVPTLSQAGENVSQTLKSTLNASLLTRLNLQTPPLEKLKPIKAIVMDVDGILTDCRIWMDASGEWRRSFCVRDGIGIKRVMKAGYHVGWITGSKAQDILARAKMLGVEYVADGRESKTEAFEEFLQKYNLQAHEVAYIGDDSPDVPLLHLAGFAATVPQAVDEAVEACDYMTHTPGGEGAARELCDLVFNHGSLSK